MARYFSAGLLLCGIIMAPQIASAQSAYLDQSGIVGAGNALSISRLPVANAKGQITYYDVSMSFKVSASGVPALAATPKFTPSPTLVTNHFLGGRYFVMWGGNATQYGTLSYGVGSGGATVWTLVMDKQPNGAFPGQAVWQTGAPAPDVAARLNKAKIPKNPNYSYGVVSVAGGNAFSGSNGLLAAEQIGSNLTLFAYSDYYTTSQGSIVLTLCADTVCSNAPK